MEQDRNYISDFDREVKKLVASKKKTDKRKARNDMKNAEKTIKRELQPHPADCAANQRNRDIKRSVATIGSVEMKANM